MIICDSRISHFLRDQLGGKSARQLGHGGNESRILYSQGLLCLRLPALFCKPCTKRLYLLHCFRKEELKNNYFYSAHNVNSFREFHGGTYFAA